MKKSVTTLLLWTLWLGACSPGNSATPTDTAAVPALTAFSAAVESAKLNSTSIPKIIVTVAIPTMGQSLDGYFPTTAVPQQDCGYVWAYQDIPELIVKFEQAVKALSPNAVSRATAFGENCVASDGHVIRFLAMETDFYVTLPVTALDDYKFFGDWIAQVMQVVNAMPNDLLMGSNSGFVEFGFEKSSAANLALRVPIQQFNQSAAGKMGEELFRMFYLRP